jgi:hypothetical protein
MVCLPMFECFRRRRFDLGLSAVDAEEPETSDGVRAGSENMGGGPDCAFVFAGEAA